MFPVVAECRRRDRADDRCPADSAESGAGEPAPRPRRYVSQVRRRQADETRERIIVAGVELVRGFDSWDWSGLTFRSVAQRAGVGERTVYRHFPNERGLRDAIMARLGEEAGVDYERLTLAEVGEVAGRMFRSLGAFAVSVRTSRAPRTTPRSSPSTGTGARRCCAP